MVDVLVYRGWGSEGVAIYGYVVDADYTYKISDLDTDNVGISNGFSQAGDGFVFRAKDTNGTKDGLVFSAGSGTTLLLNDENGNEIVDPHSFGIFGSQTVFFASTTSVSASLPPRSLLMTNGSDAPSVLVPERISQALIVGNSLYALSYDSGDLFRIEQDGSYSVIYDRQGSGNNLNIDYMFEFNGELYLRGDQSLVNDFYRVDPETNAISDLDIGQNTGGDSIYFWFDGVAENQFFFWWSGTSGSGSTPTHTELYVSDGTAAGTHLVKDIRPGNNTSYEGSQTSPRTIGDKLFFVADSGNGDGGELWVSDGTEASTFALSGTGTAVGPLGFGNFVNSIALGNELLFSASTGSGLEIFITDGTIDGTRLLVEIATGSSSTAPVFYLSDNGLAYFTIGAGPDEDSVWVTDGTAEGTFAVSDSDDTFLSSNPPIMLNLVDLAADNIPVRDIVGTSGNDILLGSFLREALFGDDGNDVLDGGSGADALDGGSGNDWADYRSSDAAVNVILAGGGTQSGGHAEGDTLTGIENLFGSSFNDVLSGNGLANYIRGGAGNDTLNSGSGDDQLRGDAGNDVLIGGAGADILDGGSGNDWADYRSSNAGVTVALIGSGAQSGGHAEGDTLTGIENLFGSSHNDVLSGNGLDNYIRGGDGNDTLNTGSGDDHLRGDNGNDVLIGGAGADILDGGAGNDWADYRGSNAGVNVALVGSGAQSGGHAEGDTLSGIENLFGSSHNDVLSGNGLDNYLRGGAGNDTLNSGSGDDTLRGDDGNDVLIGGAGADILNGGAGSDWADYRASNVGVTVTLVGSGAQSGGHAEGDTLTNIENLFGSAHNDALTGNGLANYLRGGAGNDVLKGGNGTDTLRGDAGNDVLLGGSDSDTFFFAAFHGSDTVLDFEDGSDTIFIASGASSFADLVITADGGDTLIDFTGTTVRLNGINTALITEDDFSFT
ncbi:LysM peptidoglycan-binding domain-containing protein [Roseibium sp. M-1]